MRSYEIILPCILEFFYRSAKKVFAEITVRNNLDFGYTAGAVNGADAYEKNAFQQKCYVNFLWLSRFLFLPEHNAMQEEASPGNFLITTDVRLFVGVFMMSNRQTGICFIEVFANTPYLQGVRHTHISGDHNDP